MPTEVFLDHEPGRVGAEDLRAAVQSPGQHLHDVLRRHVLREEDDLAHAG